MAEEVSKPATGIPNYVHNFRQPISDLTGAPTLWPAGMFSARFVDRQAIRMFFAHPVVDGGTRLAESRRCLRNADEIISRPVHHELPKPFVRVLR